MSATPRPWSIEYQRRGLRHIKAVGSVIGKIHCSDEDAALIVRAVNSYDTVREALEMARQDLLERPPLYSFDGYLSLLAKVEAALAAGIVKVH